MPFRSQSQRRKFFALKSEGKMDQSTIDEWNAETPKKLPERVKKGSMIKEAYEHGYSEALSFYKIAGGPGSGVAGDNTKPIDMPQSDCVSVGTRKGILDNMHYETMEIPMNGIVAVGQANYVPKKLKALIKKPEVVKEKPIDVLEVDPGHYHVIDGHHRFLAAKALGYRKIKANVREKAEITKKDKSNV